MRSNIMWRVTLRGVPACSTALVTSSDVNRAAQSATSAGTSRRWAFIQCRAMGVLATTGSSRKIDIPSRLLPSGGRFCTVRLNAGVAEGQHDDIVG